MRRRRGVFRHLAVRDLTPFIFTVAGEVLAADKIDTRHRHIFHELHHIAAAHRKAVEAVRVFHKMPTGEYAVRFAPRAMPSVHRAPPHFNTGIVVTIESARLRLRI